MPSRNLPYDPGAIAESAEALDEDAILEHFGIEGSTTLPREMLDRTAAEDDDLAMLMRSRPLGGISVGREVYRIPVEGPVERFVDLFGRGPYPIVVL
jgi:hypothetical protein